MTNVRVRFAPSPTGALHVGGARTALFNWLFARAQGGTFLLRIEDTDRARYDAAAEEMLLCDLEWLGLKWDEGPGVGGAHAPYSQSLRLPLYQRAAADLLARGMAYPCFCTVERLEGVKKEREKDRRFSGYDRFCRELPPAEAAEKIAAGAPHVLRLKVPLGGKTRFRDRLRGDIEYDNRELDDLVLLKTDGFPSYHLANVVDDHEMEITHVLRGEEWIPSTPKHQLLYDAFGWTPPEFVHLPVILDPSGGKLSKRKGAASVADFRQLGCLPAALLNFLALLGWNPGDDREILDAETLCSLFSLERVNPKSCAFDPKKLEWMNSQYIGRMPPEILLPEVKARLLAAGIDPVSRGEDYLVQVIGLLRQRMRLLTDFASGGAFFFQEPESYEEKAAAKHFGPETAPWLETLAGGMKRLPDWSPAPLENCLRETALGLGLASAAVLIHPVRLAASGASSGPGLFELLSVLGREAVVRRLRRAAEIIRSGKTWSPSSPASSG